jgi:ABC-type multidrug transport system fused ATPase/permease subunit
MLKNFKLINKLSILYYKKSFFLIIFFSLLLVLVDTLSVVSIFPLLDIAINEKNSNFNFLNISSLKLLQKKEFIFFIVIFIFFLKFIFTLISNYLVTNFKMDLQKNLSKSLLRIYLSYDYLNFLGIKESELIRNITKETEIFVNASEALVKIIVELSVILILTIIVFYSFPEITFSIFLSLLSIFFIFNFLIKKKLLKWGLQRINHDSLRIKNLSNIFKLISEIKLMSKEEQFVKLFNKDNAITQRTQRNRNLVSMAFRTFLEFAIFLILIIILFYNYYRDQGIVSAIPTLAFFLAILFRFLPGFLRITNAYQLIIFSFNSIDEIFKIHNTYSITAKENFINFKINNYEVNTMEINNLSYSYPNTKISILENINLKFITGEIIGIKGPSGAGKTTFVSILMGLIKISKGSIFYNKKNINEFIYEYKNQIGYVSQNFTLIDSNIIQNITLSFHNEQINNLKLNEAIKLSGLDYFVSKLPEKLETKIGDNGYMLSGGQQQRIALARAIYHSKTILIFDEATSSLDKELENIIYENLNYLKKDKIILFISHGDTINKFCDKLYNLENKKLTIIK